MKHIHVDREMTVSARGWLAEFHAYINNNNNKIIQLISTALSTHNEPQSATVLITQNIKHKESSNKS